MDLDRIRKMDDEELSKLLKQLSNRGNKSCLKCGDTATYFIKVENDKTLQLRKLCGLCKKCYEEFLTDLGLYDIDWDR